MTAEKVYRPLMDEKNDEAFTKSAEELPEWVERLAPRDFLEAVPGSHRDCKGGESPVLRGTATRASRNGRIGPCLARGGPGVVLEHAGSRATGAMAAETSIEHQACGT